MYPQGYEAKKSEQKSDAAPHLDEADFALESYHRVQRAKRKLLVVLLWISTVQQSQKRILAKKAKMELDEAVNGNEDEAENMWYATEDAETGEDAEKFDATVTKKKVIFNDTFSTVPENEALSDMTIIKSLLTDRRNSLTPTQQAALRRTLWTLDEKSSLKFEPRRHSSFDARGDRIPVNIPSPILEEYGGAKTSIIENKRKTSLKTAVGRVIAARRFIDLAKAESMDCNLNCEHLPAEWKNLSKESKEILAKKLTFKSLSSWEFDVLEFSEECNGAPLLFIGWAILGSPHAQRSMANDLGLEIDNGEDGYDFVNCFHINLQTLCNFLRLTESNYLPNPYHNSTHAADVLATTHSLLELGGKKFIKSPLHALSLLVAATIHDVKHPGEKLCFNNHLF
jgi:transcription termination factor NusB